jgi:hypothetical protein
VGKQIGKVVVRALQNQEGMWFYRSPIVAGGFGEVTEDEARTRFQRMIHDGWFVPDGHSTQMRRAFTTSTKPGPRAIFPN